MEDYLLFGLVARSCNINALIALRCVSKLIMDYIEDVELMAHLKVICDVPDASDFNDLVDKYNTRLLVESERTYDRTRLLIEMSSKRFNDRWRRYGCQHFETKGPLLYTFSCQGFGPLCSAHRNSHLRLGFEKDVTPIDVKELCAEQRISYIKKELMDNFPNFIETVWYTRLFSIK